MSEYEATVFVAEKAAGPTRVFDTLQSSKVWLEELIDSDNDFAEWNIKEQTSPYPDYIYEVVEGRGQVAGWIEEVPYGHE